MIRMNQFNPSRRQRKFDYELFEWLKGTKKECTQYEIGDKLQLLLDLGWTKEEIMEKYRISKQDLDYYISVYREVEK